MTTLPGGFSHLLIDCRATVLCFPFYPPKGIRPRAVASDSLKFAIRIARNARNAARRWARIYGGICIFILRARMRMDGGTFSLPLVRGRRISCRKIHKTDRRADKGTGGLYWPTSGSGAQKNQPRAKSAPNGSESMTAAL